MADLADHANELVLARLDGLLAARPALAIRESAEDCEDCGEPIPQARAAGRHRVAVAASTARTATSAVEPTSCRALAGSERRHDRDQSHR